MEHQRLPVILQKLLKEDSSGVDIGAHIGSFLSLLVKLAPKGDHLAIEPSLEKSELLRRKFPRSQILQIAISDRDERGIFGEDLARPGFSKLGVSLRNDVILYEVEKRRLDSLPIGKIDIIKMDIEGAELSAFKGGTETIRKYKPPIIFECGAECQDRALLYAYVSETLKYEILTFTDFLFPAKGALSADEFRKCGIYPFRAFNFIALPR